MTTTKGRTQSRKNRSRRARAARTTYDTLARFKAEAKEIAEARQAMTRINRGIEFEPGRMHYVIDLHAL
jgi:hypothetical protein